MTFPAPDCLHPLRLPSGELHEGTVFLAAAVDHPRIEVGDYTYASAHEPPADWAARLAPYLPPAAPERLVIGRFCQIADGVRFVTASANHRHDGPSSYPFAIFDGFGEGRASLPGPGADTRIGNDVWIGQGAVILPGACLGSGVIVGAGAVVAGRVPDYAVVAGNPARVIRMRYAPEEVDLLMRLAWWDWDIAHILANEAEIAGGSPAGLARVAPPPAPGP